MKIMNYKYLSFFLTAYFVVLITILIWLIILIVKEKKYIRDYNEKSDK